MSGEMAEQDIDDAITYGDDEPIDEQVICDISGFLVDECLCPDCLDIEDK